MDMMRKHTAMCFTFRANSCCEKNVVLKANLIKENNKNPRKTITSRNGDRVASRDPME